MKAATMPSQRNPKNSYGRERRADAQIHIYGSHAAEAALGNMARPILRVTATANAANRIADLLARRNAEPVIVSPRDLDRMLGEGAVHQGVTVEVGPLPPLDVEDLHEASIVLVLDQITDPHNVGAILRSAAAFGAGGVVMTAHHAPPLSGALAKAASGALDTIPVVLAANLARALEELGQIGFIRVGLDSEADGFMEVQHLGEKVALVLGAEDKGLRRLTRENCDFICALETASTLRSLNVSNAAAVALHTIRQAQKSRAL
ncbi:MAG: 23S rRNA (guanosine(2251)-2'-O)-methyltransferase RlmB [Hyphomicrobiales bacterium]|nr:23S rRNA (guanosine(2251)-2'-O)-methyltransferase RlmB [Hyphomicrobiales bacterium]